MSSKSFDSSVQAIGSWAFLLGVGVAILTGLVSPDNTNSTVVSFLVLLGIVVGFLNISTREANSFLLASAILVFVSGLGITVFNEVETIGVYMASVLAKITVFVVPATIVVALKSIFSLAKNK